jgi:hypothetical protein
MYTYLRVERLAREIDFSDEVKRKVLLWSDRHCCICGKACGLNIEVAHINPKLTGDQSSDIENAIPVCYYCHADLGRYFDGHPRGTKYKDDEIKKRRDQIYERYTSQLVPGLLPRILPADLPRVVFSIFPVGRFIPVQVKGIIDVFLDGEALGSIKSQKPYYSGEIIWNLNPGIGFIGNFNLPDKCSKTENKGKDLQLELNLTVIDPYEREHVLLPVCFTYDWAGNSWFLEPTAFNRLKPYLTSSLRKSK